MRDPRLKRFGNHLSGHTLFLFFISINQYSTIRYGKEADFPMKKAGVSKFKLPSFVNSAFGNRCSQKSKVFLLLSFFLFLGVLAGSFLAAVPKLFDGSSLLPLFFSGIPSPGSGLLTCFSTLLLNLLIFLTLSFLLGVTAFGAFAIPFLGFLKGVTVGLGVSSFLWTDGLSGLGKSALIYTPAAAASLVLFLLFEVRALLFSERLRKAGFSSGGESLSFHEYWKDYLRFLCLAVAVSALGGSFAFLSLLVLS